MAAWVIGNLLKITDPAAFAEYRDLAMPTIANHGGNIIVEGTNIEVVHGNWSSVGMFVVGVQLLGL